MIELRVATSDNRVGSAMSPRFIWTVYDVLLVLSIPWYWPVGQGGTLLLGFPLWAVVSLGCYLGAAVFTVFAIGPLWRSGTGDHRRP